MKIHSRRFVASLVFALSVATLNSAISRARTIGPAVKTAPGVLTVPLGIPGHLPLPGMPAFAIPTARLSGSLLLAAPAPRIVPAAALAAPQTIALEHAANLNQIISEAGAPEASDVAPVYDGSGNNKKTSVLAGQTAPETGASAAAFNFSPLDPTETYFLRTVPTAIKTRDKGRVIEMRVSHGRGEPAYLVRYEKDKGVKVYDSDGNRAPASALRGLQEMLVEGLERRTLVNPLYEILLDEIRFTLAPAYGPGDPLWRYLWSFRFSDVDSTVSYYEGYRAESVSSPRGEELELVAVSKTRGRIILTWTPKAGFRLKEMEGHVSKANSRQLAGLQLSLMREMLETNSRGDTALELLRKIHLTLNPSRLGAKLALSSPKAARKSSAEMLEKIAANVELNNGGASVETYDAAAFDLKKSVEAMERRLSDDGPDYQYKTTIGLDAILDLLRNDESVSSWLNQDAVFLARSLKKLKADGLLKDVFARTVLTTERTYTVLFYFEIFTTDGKVLHLHFAMGD
ncbi:MAG: hypothetical protein AAB036_03695 [Elusimicrobiota bacterium]